MSSFEERFEEEITRIGVSKIANTLGIARNTVYNWIANGNAPLNMLMSLQGIMGVDLHYVITGERSMTLNTVGEFDAGEALTTPGLRSLRPDQAAHLDNLEACSQDDQDAIKQLALRIAESAKQGTTQSRTKKAG